MVHWKMRLHSPVDAKFASNGLILWLLSIMFEWVELFCNGAALNEVKPPLRPESKSALDWLTSATYKNVYILIIKFTFWKNHVFNKKTA